MSKLTYEDKKEIIRLYNEENLGYMAIAHKYNVDKSTIKYLILKYNIHGKLIFNKEKSKTIVKKLRK